MFRKAILSVCVFLFVPLAGIAQVQGLPDFTELVEKQGPAVVNVSTTSAARNGPQSPVPEDDPFYDFFRRFGPPQPRDYEARSLGSGFIISADGYILTNAHVVEAAEDITVKLNDKREFKAKVIGSDRRTDVAVIKIEASGLPAVKIGDPLASILITATSVRLSDPMILALNSRLSLSLTLMSSAASTT